MDRYLLQNILNDCNSKVVLISGPRQGGKTTVAKMLFKNYVYLNYDLSEDRDFIMRKYWLRDVDGVIFDELHKMPEWKRFIKGVFDNEGCKPNLIVTGSANMDAFTKVGDSLAGRYFQYRLHPLDIKEGVRFWQDNPAAVFDRIMNYSGFPEPFLKGDTSYYRRWQRTHIDVILRQDFLDLYAVRSIKSIEVLVELLSHRVASSISYINLSNDLQVDPKSVKSWIAMLENFYILFTVTPYHHNIARSLLKEPKVYFFDIGRVVDLGARLKNLVACALLKEIHYLEDVTGCKASLHYLKTKEGHEIDFLVVVDDKPIICIEVKSSDDQLSKNFYRFNKHLNTKHSVQLALNLKKEYDSEEGVQVRDLVSFLAKFDLANFL